MVGLRRGTFRAPASTAVRQAAEAWIAGARDRSIRARGGDIYKPSAIASYESALNVPSIRSGTVRRSILEWFGAAKLSEITRLDLQDVADRMLADGLSPSTIRNRLMPLRAVFRRAVARGELAINPTSGLELPAVRAQRERIAAPSEVGRLLAALPRADRAIWATAAYAGLRRGELPGLTWEDVDLERRRIAVRRAWDLRAGPIAPKSRAAVRDVSLIARLKPILLEHRLRTGRSEGLVFGPDGARPFSYWTLVERAKRACAGATSPPSG